MRGSLGTLETISKGIDAIKFLIAADKELVVAELKIKLTEVYNTLVDAKSEIINLKEELLKLKQESQGLDVISKLRNAFRPEERSGYLILSEVIDGHQPGKYCNGCFQNKDKAISLIKHGGSLKCPSCEVIFSNPDTPPPRPISIKTNRPYNPFKY